MEGSGIGDSLVCMELGALVDGVQCKLVPLVCMNMYFRPAHLKISIKQDKKVSKISVVCATHDTIHVKY